MPLPNSYTYKPASVPDYFDAILNAEAPERFSYRFLENLGFKSTNDRLLIGVLKDLGFLDADGIPQQRYYEYLDRSQSARVLSEAIKEAYSDLFSVKTKAYELATDDVANKLRTLYAGAKTDAVIGRIARTFTALCEIADFTPPPKDTKKPAKESKEEPTQVKPGTEHPPDEAGPEGALGLGSLQYHINIVLPESRDQAVYDAIFRSLREHLK